MVDEVVVAAADPATRSAIEGIADPRGRWSATREAPPPPP